MPTVDEASLQLAEALRTLAEHDPQEIAPLLLDHQISVRHARMLSRISALLMAHTSAYRGPTQDECLQLIDNHPIWQTKIGLRDDRHEYTLGDAILALPLSDGSARAKIRQHIACAVGKMMWSSHEDILDFGRRITATFGQERCQEVLWWILAAGPGPTHVDDDGSSAADRN